LTRKLSVSLCVFRAPLHWRSSGRCFCPRPCCTTVFVPFLRELIDQGSALLFLAFFTDSWLSPLFFQLDAVLGGDAADDP
jgi:hypothetical protein